MNRFTLSLLVSVAAMASSAFVAPGVYAADTAPAAVPAVQMTCPVSHKQFTDGPDHPGVVVDGKRVAFCCNDCPAAFRADPEKYLDAATQLGNCPQMGGHNSKKASLRMVINNQLQYTCCKACIGGISDSLSDYFKQMIDPVTGKVFDVKEKSPRTDYKEQIYVFANTDNKAAFDKDPAKYAVLFGHAAEPAAP